MTLEEFKLQYPSVKADDAVIQRYLDLFRCMFQGDYGCLADYMQGLFVAHRATIATSDGAAAATIATSKSVGDVSVSYQTLGSSTDASGDYAATKYGAEFYEILMTFGSASIVMAEPYYG